MEAPQRQEWSLAQLEVLGHAKAATVEHLRSERIDEQTANRLAEQFLTNAVAAAKRWNETPVRQGAEWRRDGTMFQCFTDIAYLPKPIAEELMEKLFNKKGPFR
jgi:hypothetical protein